MRLTSTPAEAVHEVLPGALVLDPDMTWSPAQARILEEDPWDPWREDDEMLPIIQTAIVGQYGGGKTYTASELFFEHCMDNPHVRSIHGDNNPASLLIAPTMSDMMSATLTEFRKVCPSDWIVEERFWGAYWDLTLKNGHRVELRSIGGACNGPTRTGFMADEIQDKKYNKDGAWDNLVSRVRDERAERYPKAMHEGMYRFGRLSIIVSGLSQHGHVSKLFRNPEPDPSGAMIKRTYVLLTKDNTKLAKAALYARQASVSQDELRVDSEGWSIPAKGLYPAFGQENFEPMTREEAIAEAQNPDRLFSYGMDFGRYTSIVIGTDVKRPLIVDYDDAGQPITKEQDCLLLLGELIFDSDPDGEYLGRAMANKEANPWGIGRGRAQSAVKSAWFRHDPTLSRDITRPIKKALPGLQVGAHTRGFYLDSENGIRAVRRAVCDGLGNRRLLVASYLEREGNSRGIVATLRGIDDDRHSPLQHTGDAIRYLVQYKLPLPNRDGSMARPDPDAGFTGANTFYGR